MKNRKQWLGTGAVALATGLVGLGIGTAVSRADDKKMAGGGHAYEATMKEHVAMFEGADGAAKAKEMMLMMSAHQYLLGELAKSDEVKKLAATPEMKKAIDDVKATLKDHAKLDEQKAVVANKGDEAMMAIAHALLKQDAEASSMLKAAEEGTHH